MIYGILLENGNNILLEDTTPLLEEYNLIIQPHLGYIVNFTSVGSLNIYLQQNDIGITFIMTVVENDGKTPQNISSAISPTIYIIQPNLNIINGAATFVTDGTDGQLQYNIQNGDLGQIGIYKIQASYMYGSNIFYTPKIQFLVQGNF